MDHLFKQLTGAVRMHQMYVIKQKIKIKSQKLASGAQLRIPTI